MTEISNKGDLFTCRCTLEAARVLAKFPPAVAAEQPLKVSLLAFDEIGSASQWAFPYFPAQGSHLAAQCSADYLLLQDAGGARYPIVITPMSVTVTVDSLTRMFTGLYPVSHLVLRFDSEAEAELLEKQVDHRAQLIGDKVRRAHEERVGSAPLEVAPQGSLQREPGPQPVEVLCSMYALVGTRRVGEKPSRRPIMDLPACSTHFHCIEVSRERNVRGDSQVTLNIVGGHENRDHEFCMFTRFVFPQLQKFRRSVHLVKHTFLIIGLQREMILIFRSPEEAHALHSFITAEVQQKAPQRAAAALALELTHRSLEQRA